MKEPIPFNELIKVKALAIILNNDKLLLSEYFDPDTDQPFYRPVGGGIHMGETSPEAIIREVNEEIGEFIKIQQKIGVFENIYKHKGKINHEIIFLYRGYFTNFEMYKREDIIITEKTRKREIKVLWKSMEEFTSGKAVLKPDGLIELLFEKDILDINNYGYPMKTKGPFQTINEYGAIIHKIEK